MDKLNMKPRKKMDFWKYGENDSIIAGSSNGTYELDKIAAFVWQKCNGENTVNSIINDLIVVCNAENQRNQIEQDVINLLEEWKYYDLIILDYNPLHAFSEYNKDAVYKPVYKIKDVDILLIVPPSPNPVTGMNLKIQGTFPMGIAYLSAVLKKAGYKVEMLNLWVSQMNEKSINEIIKDINPTVLGISCMTDNFLNGVYIAELAKNVNKDISIVFGGPHVTFTPEESLENHRVIDVIVRNEGEITLLELMNYYTKKEGSLENIKGITYRMNAGIRSNATRPFIKDIDELPMPDRSYIDLEQSLVGLQTSRGCPGGCIFCVASTMSGGNYRVRSADNVVNEILFLYKQGTRQFFFQDDTFTGDIPRLYEILNKIKENKLEITWNAESRVDIIDKDPNIFSLMKETGCKTLQFGVEAGSQDALDNLNKRINIGQIFRSIDTAKKCGIDVVCTMLIGHPFDTRESVMDSISFARKLVDCGAFVLFSIVCPYPGTQVRKRADYYGIRIHNASYSDYFVSNSIIDTRYLTSGEIRNLYFDGMRELINYNLKSEGRFTDMVAAG